MNRRLAALFTVLRTHHPRAAGGSGHPKDNLFKSSSECWRHLATLWTTPSKAPALTLGKLRRQTCHSFRQLPMFKASNLAKLIICQARLGALRPQLLDMNKRRRHAYATSRRLLRPPRRQAPKSCQVGLCIGLVNGNEQLEVNQAKADTSQVQRSLAVPATSIRGSLEASATESKHAGISSTCQKRVMKAAGGVA